MNDLDLAEADLKRLGLTRPLRIPISVTQMQRLATRERELRAEEAKEPVAKP